MNFFSLLQFSSCSEEDMILNVLAMCSLRHGSFTWLCMRAALLFKTIAPNLGLFLNLPCLQYKHLEVCTLFWTSWGFLKLQKKNKDCFPVLCLCRINVTVRSEYKIKQIYDKDELRIIFRKYKRNLVYTR